MLLSCYCRVLVVSIVVFRLSPVTLHFPEPPPMLLIEVIQKYAEYTPVKSVFDKVLVDMQYIQSGPQRRSANEGFQNQGRTVDGYHHSSSGLSFSGTNNKKFKELVGGMTAIMIIVILLSVLVFVLNIIGIVYAFSCKHVAVGVIAIIGMFFGLPIGLVYYLIYLCNPSICG